MEMLHHTWEWLNSLNPWGTMIGAFVGSILTAILTWKREALKAKRDMTQGFIDEFYSAAFLRHRIGTGKIRDAIRAGVATDETVALGFFYPGSVDAYEGATLDGLNEHQHLEAFLGYVRRLAHAVDERWVHSGTIRVGISGSFIWHAELLVRIADEITRLVRSPNGRLAGAVLPPSVKAIRTVIHMMRLPAVALKIELPGATMRAHIPPSHPAQPSRPH